MIVAQTTEYTLIINPAAKNTNSPQVRAGEESVLRLGENSLFAPRKFRAA